MVDAENQGAETDENLEAEMGNWGLVETPALRVDAVEILCSISNTITTQDCRTYLSENSISISILKL